MKIGIVGYPGAGKSAVFQALTGLTHNGRGVTLGTVKVPDPRVDRLAEIYDPRKTTYAELVFADLPGSVRGGGFSPEMLGRMRDMDLLAHVLKGFGPDGGDAADPLDELERFEMELQLADLEVVERRLARLHKGDKSERPGERALLTRYHEALEASTPLRLLTVDPREEEAVQGTVLLSRKRALRLLNLDEDRAAEAATPELRAATQAAGTEVTALSAVVESEIAQLEPEDREAFLEDLGLEVPARDRFVSAAYSYLKQISFFTVGRDEVRAWTVPQGATAPEAAGVIHSDLQRGFIRADVTRYEDIVAHHGDEAACRKAGLTRKEGRNYVVQDGDVMNVHFKV